VSRKIKATYDDNSTRGDDLTEEVLIPGDLGDDTPVTFTRTQLSNHVAEVGAVLEISDRVDGLLTGTPVPDPDPAADPTWSLTLADNKLVPDSSVFNFTTEVGAAWAETTNDPFTPTNDAVIGISPPTGFTSGLVGTLSAVSGWGVTEVRRLYQYDDVNGIVQILTSTGDSGITITSKATLPPSQITDFSIVSKTDTTITVTFSLATIIDEVTLRYDIVDSNNNSVINASGTDVTPGTVVLTGLTSNTLYNLAVKCYPAEDVLELRRTISNIDSDTTAASSVTFTAFTLAPIGAGNTNATVQTFTSTVGDQWYWSIVPTPPTEASTWISPLPTPASTTIDLGAAGDHEVFAWVNLSTDPTNISLVQSTSVTLAPSSGNDIFSIDTANSDLTITEMGAPSGTITVVRSETSGAARTVDITSVDGVDAEAAIAGDNYQALNTTLSFGAGDTSLTVDYDVLLQNIGHINGVPNTRTFTITLSNPQVSGSISSVAGSATITIQGSNGYVGNDDAIDINNPPTNLTKLTGTQLITASGTTLDLVEIDANGSDHAIVISNDITNITIKRFIVRNSGKSLITWGGGWADHVTIKNGVANNWNLIWKDTTNSSNAVIECYCNADIFPPTANFCSDMTIRGIKARGHGRFAILLWTRFSRRIILENNYFRNTSNEDLGMTREEYKNLFSTTSPFPVADGHLLQLWDNRGGQHIIRGNVTLSERFGNISGHDFDLINIGASAPLQEADRCFVEFNSVYGSSLSNHSGSPVGLILDGLVVPDNGFYTFQDNIAVETQNVGINLAGYVPDWCVIRRNWLYCGPNSLETNQAGRGLAGGTQLTVNNNEVTDNNILWYAWREAIQDTAEANTWWPIIEGNPRPIGWESQNIMDGTGGNANWTADGEITVKGLKATLNQPGIGDGFRIRFASAFCPPGNAVLRWDDGASNLYFAAYGDAEGIAVAVNVTPEAGHPRYGDWETNVIVYSANPAYWVSVSINPTLVAALNTDYAYGVKVTSYRIMSDNVIMAYDQTTGNYIDSDWAGVERITVSGTVPAIPTTVAAASASATSIDLTWDAMGGADSYRVYRTLTSGVGYTLIASPVTNSYTDTELTEGVRYYYVVASADEDVISDSSAETSAVPVDATGIITDGEFQTDSSDGDFGVTKYTNWSKSSDISVSVSGGEITITNASTTNSQYIYFERTGLSLDVSGTTTYLVQGNVTLGSSLIDFDTASSGGGGAWKSGDVLRNNSISVVNSPFENTAYDPTTWASGAVMYVTLWVGPNSTVVFDYIRLVEA